MDYRMVYLFKLSVRLFFPLHIYLNWTPPFTTSPEESNTGSHSTSVDTENESDLPRA